MARQPFVVGRSRIRNPQTGEEAVWDGNAFAPVPSGGGPSMSLDTLTANERGQVLEARDAAQRGRGMMPDLNRFEELNQQEGTGHLTQRFGQAMGVPNLLGDPQEDEMRAITERLLPLQRQAGSGPMTDKDADMYRTSLPNIARGQEANSNVAHSYRNRAREAGDYAAFLDWYVGQNRTTAGASEQWGRYTATPQERRGPWRGFFNAELPRRAGVRPRSSSPTGARPGAQRAGAAPQRPPGVPATARWTGEAWEE